MLVLFNLYKMLRNITEEMITSTIAAILAICVTYGYVATDQAETISTAVASIALIALALAKDPK